MIKIPKFEAFQQTSTDQAAAADFEEIVELKWQQKIFSKAERSYYAQKENCKSELETRYHHQVKEIREKECGVIFTYIHEDNYVPADAFGPSDVKLTRLRRNVEAKATSPEKKSSDMFIDPGSSVVPSRYVLGDEFTKMFVMADLEPVTLLAIIHYRPADGAFFIYPDFNDSDNEYQIEIDQNSKQLFGYVIENRSVKVSEAANQLKQKEKLHKIKDETCELMKKLHFTKDPDFECPKFCRILLLMEIHDGFGFEYDNLHVRLEMKIPKFVRVVEGSLEGSTHSSFKQNNVWNFGHCHSLILDIDDEFSLTTSKPDLISIGFEVISIDPTWGRERREGMATLKLPIDQKSGNGMNKLACFRDLQSGSYIRDFLERFFLGGIHKSKISEADVGSNFYGNQTVTTGTLNVKLQKIIQTRMSKRNFLRMQSIEEIIESYHKAKENLRK